MLPVLFFTFSGYTFAVFPFHCSRFLGEKDAKHLQPAFFSLSLSTPKRQSDILNILQVPTLDSCTTLPPGGAPGGDFQLLVIQSWSFSRKVWPRYRSVSICCQSMHWLEQNYGNRWRYRPERPRNEEGPAHKGWAKGVDSQIRLPQEKQKWDRKCGTERMC